jgi:hypothetical protein
MYVELYYYLNYLLHYTPRTPSNGMEYTTVQDSGQRESFATGAHRDTSTGKGRFDLLPPYALKRIAQHFENGAIKYDARNWEKGIPTHRYLSSGIGHALSYLDGKRDEDHLAAACWNLLCLIQTEKWISDGVLPGELQTLPGPRQAIAGPVMPDTRTLATASTKSPYDLSTKLGPGDYR